MQPIDTNATKDSLLSPGLLTYLGVLGISVMAGVTSFFESKEPFSWRTIAAHITSSGFAGMLAGFACEYMHVTGPGQFVAVGVAAHMGTPALINLAMKVKLVRNLMDESGLSEKDKQK